MTGKCNQKNCCLCKLLSVVAPSAHCCAGNTPQCDAEVALPLFRCVQLCADASVPFFAGTGWSDPEFTEENGSVFRINPQLFAGLLVCLSPLASCGYAFLKRWKATRSLYKDSPKRTTFRSLFSRKAYFGTVSMAAVPSLTVIV